MNEKEILIPVLMNDSTSPKDKCRGVIYRSEGGDITYLSYLDNQRYATGRLEFEGSEEEFIKALKQCPPDDSESYTAISGIWIPIWSKNYSKNKKFVEDVKRMHQTLLRNSE